MSLKDIPPSINSTDALMGLPGHLDAFQLAPAATTTEYAASATASSQTTASPSQQAFSAAVSTFSRDMPILMHGSGDVVPERVNPDTVQLLSELTVRYIANLVDAAVDAQQLLAGGLATTPPPPRYPRSRTPALPFVPDDKKRSAEEDNVKALVKKRPRRPDVDYWDLPETMPEPKIVKRTTTAATSPLSASRQKKTEEEEGKPVHVDRWVGVAGVDLWEQSRSRKAYVRMPDAVGTKCFLFPICHDGFLYGKVRQIMGLRLQIAPLLIDSVVMREVETEGSLVKRHAPRRKKNESKAKDSGDADVEDEPEQEEQEETEEDVATWPIEFLLPVHAITEAAS